MGPGQTFWLAIVLSISAQIGGQQSVVVSPPYVAATNGDQNITINCTIQNYISGEIAWGYKPLWNPNAYIIIYNSTFIDAANYSVDVYDYQWQGSQYKSVDLTIKSAKPGQAATYACVHVFSVGHSSFIVLDPLQCPAQDLNEYEDGTSVSISCSVNFYHKDGLGNPPDINIFKGGILLQGVTTATPNTKTVTVNQTLRKEDDNVEFVCLLSFVNDSPHYSENCSVVYYVKHEVSEISFYPPTTPSNLTSIYVGSQINCATNGRPPPIITWYNDEGVLIGEGNNLTVTEAMLSWAQPVTVICTAINTINGGLSYTSVSANYTFLVLAFAETSTNESVESPAIWISLTLASVIVVAVLLSIASVAITRLILKRKDDSVETGSKSGNIDAENTYQNLKTTQLNGNGEIAVHYDNLGLDYKGYETIDEYSLKDPNYASIQDNEYLDAVAEADEGNIEKADDNDYEATNYHQSEQTEANIAYQTLHVLGTPSIQEALEAE